MIMDNALFLQSEVVDPYAIYAAQPPLRRDAGNALWAVYSHAACREVLLSDAFGIPPASLDGLGDTACMLVQHLVRLSNPPQHAAAKEAALRLHGMMRRADAAALVKRLIGGRKRFDWVEAVCRKLPALLLLESFGFPAADVDAILPQMDMLAKLMAQRRSAEQLRGVNAAAEDVYPRVERYLADTGMPFASEEERCTCIVNLIGLLIQSVDAGRGLLANALLQVLQHVPSGDRGLPALQRAVMETLRFDPPIHNTRRVALRHTTLCGETIRRGEAVLVVLAAANRDACVFSNADRFDHARSDGDTHLTFGAGIHECVARHLSMQMAAEALSCLFAGGETVNLSDAYHEVEAAVNARLVKRMEIVLE
jgi:cytochrome P450